MVQQDVVHQWTAAVALAPPRQTFGRSVSVTNLAVLTSKVMHMLRVSAPENRPSECAAAAVLMRRLLSTDGHGAASILGDFDCRWPWLKRQVDRPSGGGAITTAAQHLES